jgi:hypothetical protein
MDSFAAVDVRLCADDIARLEAAAPVGGTAGNRYCDAALAQVGQ